MLELKQLVSWSVSLPDENKLCACIPLKDWHSAVLHVQ